MSFKLKAQMSGLAEALDAADIKARMDSMKAMRRAGEGMKDDLRDQMLAAGFSDRFSKTWQDKVYPSAGSSLTPAALVFSKAPGIVDAYARGVTIIAKAGRRLLAIPTDDTPRKGSGGQARQPRAKTPREVEAQFGRRLRFVPAKSAQGSHARNGTTRGAVGYLLMDNLVARKETGRFRKASVRELAGTSRNKARQVQAVVMFVLVASVRIPKKLDLQTVLDRAAATLPQLLAEEWSA
ncbi:DUF6441 family protein [Sphingomonas nostoxanthinifaciens]|uniref:DUF6441 family protein n=1 Tax=Sphingomonas nostoxanthinifaciens TaxID=2872652 RepID=UPI001CC1F332|nr:DUF6441 family protein [Sphingomonas nostoxanthinifaciens]UAK24186.1 DUF6441 family protein [Sphingomonas nostoxanthinifaciens]